jgi:hypothetical protein
MEFAMTDEHDPFESWGGDPGASEQRRRPAVRRSLPSLSLASVIPTGRLMPVVLLTLILAAGSTVGAELTRSGPFAATALAASPPSVSTDAAASARPLRQSRSAEHRAQALRHAQRRRDDRGNSGRRQRSGPPLRHHARAR